MAPKIEKFRMATTAELRFTQMACFNILIGEYYTFVGSFVMSTQPKYCMNSVFCNQSDELYGQNMLFLPICVLLR